MASDSSTGVSTTQPLKRAPASITSETVGRTLVVIWETALAPSLAPPRHQRVSSGAVSTPAAFERREAVLFLDQRFDLVQHFVVADRDLDALRRVGSRQAFRVA